MSHLLLVKKGWVSGAQSHKTVGSGSAWSRITYIYHTCSVSIKYINTACVEKLTVFKGLGSVFFIFLIFLITISTKTLCRTLFSNVIRNVSHHDISNGSAEARLTHLLRMWWLAWCQPSRETLVWQCHGGARGPAPAWSDRALSPVPGHCCSAEAFKEKAVR